MNCDPNALAQAARCFSCLPPHILDGIKTYLLCQWENAGPAPPPTPDFGISWTPVDIDLTALVGLFAFNGSAPLAGITNITVGDSSNSEGYDFEFCPDLLSLSFPNLTTFTGSPYITIRGCPLLTSVSFPVFVTGPTSVFRIRDCASLTTITMPAIIVPTGRTWLFDTNALTALTVNAILARWVASPGIVSGTLNLSGGTSAAPSGQGILDKATLIGQGVTVTTN